MPLTPQIISGMVSGEKVTPRADFLPNKFDQAIVTKGYRMFWSRGGICPCVNNEQTDQPDPTCSLCGGDAYYFFLPDPAVAQGATLDSQGNEIVLNAAGDGVLIYVHMTSMTSDIQVFEKFGEWMFGASRATTQHQNRLGYRDRLVSIDSLMAWAQIIKYDGATLIPVTGDRQGSGLRYPIISVNQLRSRSKIYRLGDDFELTPGGEIQWTGDKPVANERLSIHGSVQPVWIVMDQVHTYRDTFVQGGTISIKTQEHRKLPLQSIVKLEYLVNPQQG